MPDVWYQCDRCTACCKWPGDVKVEAYELKASIYAQNEKHQLAIENIDKAIDLSPKPKETWYQLKLAMHYELKEYGNCRDVLGILVRQWPAKKQYWTQLSSINVTLKRDSDALAMMELAHRQGLLDKETDYIQLFSLYGYMEVPFKAAQVLEEGLEKGFVEPTKKHYENLGNAWYACRELDKAIAALSKAGEKSLDGKIHMQVAYILVDKEDWEAAKKELEAAIRKGGLKDTQLGNLLVLLGMSELNTGNKTAARKAFLDARKYPKARSSAQQWINHLDELAGDSAINGSPSGNGGQFASVWEPNGNGGFVVTDLSDQIPSRPEWYLRIGFGINDDLWIAGEGRKRKKGKYSWHGVLLAPSP